MIRALRILVEIVCPSVTLRFWDGSGGPYLDGDGNVWRAASLTEEALDEIEAAMNFEAVSISLTIQGADTKASDALYADYEAGEVIGSRVRIMIQALDADNQPDGDPTTEFTGYVANLVFNESTSLTGMQSLITVTVANRATLRSLTSGEVLSDVCQRLRSKRLNPSQTTADRFAERTPGLLDHTIRWPNW